MREGFRTQFAATGLSALAMIEKGPIPDLILLDLMLPDLPGIEVCRQLRATAETRRVPVVMVTAREEEADRVAGFEAGADDYIVKPFSVRELIHRIRAILRRRSAKAGEGAADAPGRTTVPEAERRVEARIAVEPGTRRVWVDGIEVIATDPEFKVVTRLLTRQTRAE